MIFYRVKYLIKIINMSDSTDLNNPTQPRFEIVNIHIDQENGDEFKVYGEVIDPKKKVLEAREKTRERAIDLHQLFETFEKVVGKWSSYITDKLEKLNSDDLSKITYNFVTIEPSRNSISPQLLYSKLFDLANSINLPYHQASTQGYLETSGARFAISKSEDDTLCKEIIYLLTLLTQWTNEFFSDFPGLSNLAELHPELSNLSHNFISNLKLTMIDNIRTLFNVMCMASFNHLYSPENLITILETLQEKSSDNKKTNIQIIAGASFGFLAELNRSGICPDDLFISMPNSHNNPQFGISPLFLEYIIKSRTLDLIRNPYHGGCPAMTSIPAFTETFLSALKKITELAR